MRGTCGQSTQLYGVAGKTYPPALKIVFDSRPEDSFADSYISYELIFVIWASKVITRGYPSSKGPLSCKYALREDF